MATLVADGEISVGRTFSNDHEIVRAKYDFALDGGATTDKYDIFEALKDLAVHSAYVKVGTAFTSGGSATVKIGVEGVASEDQILAATAVASMTAGAILKKDDSNPQKIASGQKLVVGIATAALTAGDMELVMAVSRY